MGPLIFGETEVLQQLCRYSAEEYARKFGSAPAAENLTNDIDDAKPLAKEEGSLLNTVVEIAMKFVPLIIDTLAGSTGPSQTDRFFPPAKTFLTISPELRESTSTARILSPYETSPTLDSSFSLLSPAGPAAGLTKVTR